MKHTSINHASRGPHNPFAPPTAQSVYRVADTIQEAVVVDVIINDKHPEYHAEGYNIGAVKFRLLKGSQYRDQGSLHWALPLESNITEYPLLHEIVTVVESLNRFYYTRKINTSSRVTSHAIFGLNEELSTPVSPAERSKTMIGSTTNPVLDRKEEPKLGKYFMEKPQIYRLRHDEGDLVIEGRSGHSMRFGAAWKAGTNFQSTAAEQAPNLLIRVGPDPNQKPSVPTPFGLVTEDINKDASSLWMVTDQIVPLTYSTVNSAVHAVSVTDFPRRLDGNQIVINTDRFVVNTKKDKIMGFSNLGIHWTTNMDFTVDADRDYVSQITRDVKITIGRDETEQIGRDYLYQIGRNVRTTVGQDQTWQIGRNEQLTVGTDQTVTVGRNTTFRASGFYDGTAGSRYSIIAPKVYLGLRQGETEPVPIGATLAQFLSDLIDVFITNAPLFGEDTKKAPVKLQPAVIMQLMQLKADAAKRANASFNSATVYTKK